MAYDFEDITTFERYDNLPHGETNEEGAKECPDCNIPLTCSKNRSGSHRAHVVNSSSNCKYVECHGCEKLYKGGYGYCDVCDTRKQGECQQD